MGQFSVWLKNLKNKSRGRDFSIPTVSSVSNSLNRRKKPTFGQLKYLPGVLSNTEKRIVSLLVVVFLTAGIVLAIRFYISHTEPVPIVGGSYTEGLIGNPSYINPVLSQSNDTDMDISRLVFSSLFKHNKSGELIPDLAASHELSEDQKTYTIHLREGVKWHDGEIFSSSDVITTIDSIQATEIKSPLAGNLKGVTANALDEQTVILTLQEPFAPFLSSLTFGILPAHIWNDIPLLSFHLAESNLKPIGTGPFKFKSLKKDKSGNIKSYELARNANYYGQSAYIETITFKFYPDLASLIEAGRSNKVEGLGYVPKESKETLSKNKDIVPRLLHLPQYTAVFLNQKNQLLKNLDIKQSLAYSLNKEEVINEVLAGEGEAIHGPILPGYIGFNPEIRKYDFDPTKAMETLENAGWAPDEDSGMRKKGDQELRFTLTTIDQPDFVATANMLKDYWQKIGVGVELRIIDSSRIQKYVIKPRDFEALLVGEIVGTDPDPYSFWHSSQGRDPGLNLSVFVNKDVDQLLEEARKINDEEQRRMKYLHFQNILADELPAIFLYNPTYTYGLNKKIQGFELDRIITPADRFTDIEEWYINTKRR
ncbi:hypothetical protein KKG41_03545 [Patescibacteria group bacterium]|nr:hypothetical protein [Patescibacteria group bacterium]MBU1890205.1 hypothetical protein [Patescibacteria group bacterium]